MDYYRGQSLQVIETDYGTLCITLLHIIKLMHYILVGGLENLDYFLYIGNGIIIPTDFHSIIFQRGR